MHTMLYFYSHACMHTMIWVSTISVYASFIHAKAYEYKNYKDNENKCFFIASTSVKHHMFTSWDSVEANGATFQWGRTIGFLISTGAVNIKYNNLSVCYAHKGTGRAPNDAQFARLWYNRTEIHSLQVCPMRGDNPKFASEGCVYCFLCSVAAWKSGNIFCV